MVAIEDITSSVVTISEAELVQLLSTLRGASFITITAKTDARLKKTGNPHGKVWKVNRVNVCVNFQYDQGVLRRLEKEGKSEEDFRKGESWHTPVLTDDGKLTPFCSHNKTGQLYLRCQRLATIGEAAYFTEGGVELTRADVCDFLPKSSTYENQGLDKPLEFLVYGLEGIVEVVVAGVTYVVQ